jgi:hypothetical protein
MAQNGNSEHLQISQDFFIMSQLVYYFQIGPLDFGPALGLILK